MHPAAVGPFKIERELGRGGMGEVYLARDTRLDRQVAIKALPAHLAQDPDRLGRFQREAKVLASLNHPGIGAIYGLEEASGHQYLILEYVEGETLADRLARGPIPVSEALPLASQIAAALEVAHEKGIIHRDLKPGNVMLSGDGLVKVLDFGLARTADDAGSATNAAAFADSPTITSPARLAHSPTIPGVVMGTAGYMSPEQARGKPVDKRSDIFSFGCVLYEMLTGVLPFRGETVADFIGATLHMEMDPSLLPVDTPKRVRDLLNNCLAKDRKNRLRDIGDARLELERAIADPREELRAAGAMRPWWRSAGVLAAASSLAVAAVAVAWLLRPQSEGTQGALSAHGIVRTTIMPPKGMTYRIGVGSVALSPDGARIAMVLRPLDTTSDRDLYLRELSSLEFRKLAGTAGAAFPFWSPDGKSIAFFADGKLKRVDLPDGIVRVICDAPGGRGGSWGCKGTIVFAPSSSGGLWKVGDSGGTPVQVTTPTSIDEPHRMPHMLPDGEKFLFYVFGSEASGIYAFDPGAKKPKFVMATESEARFVAPGLLAFIRDNNLMVQPFDPRTLELSGVAKPIAAGVHQNSSRHFNNFGLTADGTLVYHPLVPARRFRLEWVSPDGAATPIAIPPVAMSPINAALTLSPDGRRAVTTVLSNDVKNSLVLLDLERGTQVPIGDPKWFLADVPLWSPATQSVLCGAQYVGRLGIWSIPLSSSGPPTELTSQPGFDLFPSSVSPDGKTLLYVQFNRERIVSDIMSLPLEQNGKPTPLLADPVNRESNPRVSPSGHALAYLDTTQSFGIGKLKIVSFPSMSVPVTVSVTDSTSSFGWLGENEIAWLDTSRRAWSTTITIKDGEFDASVPKPLFGGQLLESNAQIVAIDTPRQRFLRIVEDVPEEEPGLIFVSDWRQATAQPSTAPR